MLLFYVFMSLALGAFAKDCLVTESSLDRNYIYSADSQVTLEFGISSQARYAVKHRMTFLLSTQPSPGVEPFDKRLDWGRLEAVRSALDLCDWVLIMEGDVIVTNDTITVAELTHGNKDIIVARDVAMNINTGIWLVRSSQTSRDFLERLFKIRDENSRETVVKQWASNGAFIVALREQRWKDSVSVVPWWKLNIYPEQWNRDHFVVHFAGKYPKAPPMKAFMVRLILSTP